MILEIYRKIVAFLLCEDQAASLPREDAKTYTVSCAMTEVAFLSSITPFILMAVFGRGYTEGENQIRMLDGIFTWLYLGIWVLFRFRFIRIGKLLLLTATNTNVAFLVYFYGLSANGHLYFFACFVAPLMIFSARNRSLTWAFMGVSLLLFVFSVLRYKVQGFRGIIESDGTPNMAFYLIFNSVLAIGVLGIIVYYFHRAGRMAEEKLDEEKGRSETLLLNILPEPVAARLKNGESLIADRFEEATVLFADIVNFTPLSSRMRPEELIRLLNEVFSGFDSLADNHGLEKIKTIGDAYLVVGGVPEIRKDHANAVADMAISMLRMIEKFEPQSDQKLNLRIGIHSGPLVAGVIGRKKFIYDLWGDTVNTASRMEAFGLPGKIHISSQTKGLLGSSFACESRGEIEIKGKGLMETFLLHGYA